jgi:hypothetical protein
VHLGEGSGAFEVSAISVIEQVYDSDPAVFADSVVSKVATFDKRDDVRFAGVEHFGSLGKGEHWLEQYALGFKRVGHRRMSADREWVGASDCVAAMSGD